MIQHRLGTTARQSSASHYLELPSLVAEFASARQKPFDFGTHIASEPSNVNRAACGTDKMEPQSTCHTRRPRPSKRAAHRQDKGGIVVRA